MQDKAREIRRRNARRNSARHKEPTPLDIDAILGREKKKKRDRWDEDDDSWSDK
jgi:hypothetical protein